MVSFQDPVGGTPRPSVPSRPLKSSMSSTEAAVERPPKTVSTPAKGMIKDRAGGSTSPHWIHSLATSQFRDKGVVLPQTALDGMVNRGGDHHHCLIVVGDQSTTGRPSSILHCTCAWCDYHFVISTKYQEEHADGLCTLSGNLSGDRAPRPLHHLTWIQSEPLGPCHRPSSVYYAVINTAYFVCSAPSCTFEVTLEVSEPRLRQDFRNMLQDTGRVRENLRRAKALEPERFQNTDASWEQHAPSVLNTYLKSLLDGTIREISKGNKRFLVTLGPDCAPIMHALEFRDQILIKDGVEVDCFVPTPLPPPTPGLTAPGSRRAFFEDIRAEVENMILRQGIASDPKPAYAFELLERNLDCFAYPKSAYLDPSYPSLSRRKVREEARELCILGALREFPDSLIQYAYDRQCQVWRSYKNDLLGALHQVATTYAEHEDLGEFWAIEYSAFQAERIRPPGPDATMALGYFGVADVPTVTEEFMSTLFLARVEADPAQMPFARHMLEQYGQDRRMDNLVALAKAKLPVEVARRILSVKADDDDAQIYSRAFKMCENSPRKESLHRAVADCLAVIGESIQSSYLVQRSSTLLSALSTAEQDAMTVDDGVEYKELSNLTQENPKPLQDLPVGLENIGNTCYLNSILQLLFSIKPTRDFTLNFNQHCLELNDEIIATRRIGGNQMILERAEAIVSQIFISELRKLFIMLSTSTAAAVRPSQLLANSALISTHQLILKGQAQTATHDNRPSNPPPLPARSYHIASAPDSIGPQNLQLDAHSGGYEASPVVLDSFLARGEMQRSDFKKTLSPPEPALVDDISSDASVRTLVNGLDLVNSVDNDPSSNNASATGLSPTLSQPGNEDTASTPPKSGAEWLSGSELWAKYPCPDYDDAGDEIMLEVQDFVSSDEEAKISQPEREATIWTPPKSNADWLNGSELLARYPRPDYDDACDGSGDQVMSETRDLLRPTLEAAKVALPVDMDMGLEAAATTTAIADIDVLDLEEIGEKLLDVLQYQKRSSGTDQQDFEEVYGRIINLAQSSIAPTNAADGVQHDLLMDTFYVKIVNYTREETGPGIEEVVLDRCITAFPAEFGSCTLLEALDRNFDLQKIDGSRTERYSSIRQLPPVLNILIQRSQTNGIKNKNSVVLPEVLNMSRYMDCVSPAAEVANRLLLSVRSKAWLYNERIARLARDASQGVDHLVEVNEFLLQKTSSTSGRDVLMGQNLAFTDIATVVGDKLAYAGLSGPQVADLVKPKGEEAAVVTTPVPENWEAITISSGGDVEFTELDLREQMGQEAEELKRVREALFMETADLFDDHDVLYRIHAVICHSGGLQAGHYWVWIRDHERGLWRKYNDSQITEVAETDKVLSILSTASEPYYLCYVRDHDKAQFVDVPARMAHSVVDNDPAPFERLKDAWAAKRERDKTAKADGSAGQPVVASRKVQPGPFW